MALPSRVALATMAAFSLASQAAGQASPHDAAVIDTIVITRLNVFTPEVAQSNFVYRAMNAIHVRTRSDVIRREILIRPGHPYDSARVAESERLLRERQIFSSLAIDTVRTDGRLALRIDTQDGWSLKPKFSFAVASDGTLTGTLGINDINVLGSGNQAYAAYTKEVDRSGLNASGVLTRLIRGHMDIKVNYAGLSDGNNGNWFLGEPFRSMESPFFATYDGLSADQRILQYRTEGGAEPDTTIYQRNAFANNLNVGISVSSDSRQYVRVGLMGQVRQEEYVLASDTSMVPDTVSGTIGGWVEWKRAEYRTLSKFNGFGTEDIDLSSLARFTANATPKGLGWQEDGMALGVNLSHTLAVKHGFVWASLDTNARFTDAGVDSSRVVVNVMAGLKPAPQHALAVQVQAGVLTNTAPGQEFDLGFTNAPRSWQPHAFVGTRQFWASAEYRWFKWDNVLNLFGLGLAGFLDYGGAWYEDQTARFGGNVGGGLRMGSTLSTFATMTRFDLGYKVGPGITGSRWVFAAGSGFVFPRRDVPVVNYTAVAPR